MAVEVALTVCRSSARRPSSPASVTASVRYLRLWHSSLRTDRKSDPRSLVIRKVAEDVFAVTGKNPLQKTAMALHDAALKVRTARGCLSDTAGRLLRLAAAVSEVRSNLLHAC